MTSPLVALRRRRTGRSPVDGPDGLDRADRADRAERVEREPLGSGSSFAWMFGLVVVLNLIGLLMVLSASAVTALYEYGSPWYQFQRQFLWLSIGSVALLIALRIDYHRWRRYTRLVLLAAIALLVLVLVPGVGVDANGATRWLGYGPFSFQPSELAKLALVLFAADLLARRGSKVRNWHLGLKPVMVVFIVVAALVMAQPNLGTTLVLAAVVLVMCFVAGTPTTPLAVTTGGLVAGATFFAFSEPYRFRRLMAFRDPWADPLNLGFQTVQSQTGLANGGLLGTGLGEGRAKWGFLPEAHTDFIYAIIGEELGLLGALAVVALFVLLGVLGVRTALRAPDRYGMLLATGITAWILVQAFVNIGAVVGVLPITGVPLPFVSAGGSSLLFTMAGAGLLLNIARQAR
ncbi:putative lipid II flippase FtsW [Rhabdothermincola salaria]|uniref:putative lipid II flippase FtsW n=1 Tax=Rhabdothermincola salaria TaxID=2903142 RepID=UPI001E3BF14E|nr:putative lipid II flippase FtsW [Rhabdothermincola salaria]MCD9622478.1 putative lipid II flippase FtsW [Rhabdothermincola salaria]